MNGYQNALRAGFARYAVQRELNEVARRSLWRNLSKWGASGRIAKPVAMITAFIEEPGGIGGNLPTDRLQRQRLNRARNEVLKKTWPTSA